MINNNDQGYERKLTVTQGEVRMIDVLLPDTDSVCGES